MLLVYLHRLELTPHHGYSRKHLCTKFEMYNCKCFPRHHYIQAIVVIHCIDPKNEFGFAQQKREKESTQKKREEKLCPFNRVKKFTSTSKKLPRLFKLNQAMKDS